MSVWEIFEELLHTTPNHYHQSGIPHGKVPQTAYSKAFLWQDMGTTLYQDTVCWVFLEFFSSSLLATLAALH